MDLTKIGKSTWNSSYTPYDRPNSSSQDANSSETAELIESFRQDAKQLSTSKSVENFLHATRAKHLRKYVGLDHDSSTPSLHPMRQTGYESSLSQSADLPGGWTSGSNGHEGSPLPHRKKKSMTNNLPLINPKTNTIQFKNSHKSMQHILPTVSKTLDFTAVKEHPPTRSDIKVIEQEFDERIREICNADETNLEALDRGHFYQPYKDMILAIRNKNLSKYNIQYDQLINEPWLELLIKCECLTSACDDVTDKVIGMLNVLSLEIGSILRKVKHTYKQSFQELTSSWEILRSIYKSTDFELKNKSNVVVNLEKEIQIKENQIKKYFENELKIQEDNFELERQSLKDTIKSQNVKIDQLSDTLHTLNSLLKNMQSTVHGTSSAFGMDHIDDIKDKCRKLEYENFDLNQRVIKTDKLEFDLKQTMDALKIKELDYKNSLEEIMNLNNQIKRRDEGITVLIDKDLQKTAEIEKLQQQLKCKEADLEETLLKDISTSVLCVRCKKNLDDISNIRESSIENELNSNPNHKLKCEAYRLLLPNIKGRHPERSVSWLRRCLRSILLSKIKEDVNILAIHGEITRFPQYVYAWFERPNDRLRGVELTKQLILCDDDRWALYYGTRALSRDNDPECMVMWSLLDEFFQEDGIQFISLCLSVLLSISGREIWEQYGTCAMMNQNITTAMKASKLNESDGLDSKGLENTMNNNQRGADKVNRYIWVHVNIAKEATKLILHRAMESHIAEVLEAIDAFTVIPFHDEDDNSVLPSDWGVATENTNPTIDLEEIKDPQTASKSLLSPSRRPPGNKQPTHINLYLWLRLMLKQLKAEQVQRRAAVKLMFETASIGALTPSLPNGYTSPTSKNDTNKPIKKQEDGKNNKDNHVEFPQFQSICRALFPRISTTDIASLYATCYFYSSYHFHNQEYIASHQSNNKSQAATTPHKRRVTAEVFLEVVDMKGLFSKYMNFVALPLFSHYNLFNDEFIHYKKVLNEKQQEEYIERQAIQSLFQSSATQQLLQHLHDQATSVAGDSLAMKSKPDEGYIQSPKTKKIMCYSDVMTENGPIHRYFKLTRENELRGELGSLVHRKYALMMPELKKLMDNIPEKWKKMLDELMENVSEAIDDAYVKQKPGTNSRKYGQLRSPGKLAIDSIDSLCPIDVVDLCYVKIMPPLKPG